MTGKTLKITQEKTHKTYADTQLQTLYSQSVPGQQRLSLEQPVWMKAFAVKRTTEVSALRCPLLPDRFRHRSTVFFNASLYLRCGNSFV